MSLIAILGKTIAKTNDIANKPKNEAKIMLCLPLPKNNNNTDAPVFETSPIIAIPHEKIPLWANGIALAYPTNRAAIARP